MAATVKEPAPSASLTLAVPPDRVIGPPRLVPLTLTCTVPVGVPAPGAFGATAMSNVVPCPATVGFVSEVTVVVVWAWSTV